MQIHAYGRARCPLLDSRTKCTPKLSRDRDTHHFFCATAQDERSKPDKLRKIIPPSVPSGKAVHVFQ